jgi:lipopolysaccharide biosynthesis protein
MGKLRSLATWLLAEHAPSAYQRFAPSLWCRHHVVLPLTGVPEGRRFCLFAHYDPHHRIDDYVVHNVKALQGAGLEVVFVTTTRPSVSEYARITPFCAAVIERENVGIDFGSWRTALLTYPKLMDSRLLVFTNDSVYGPLLPLGPILMRLENADCDFFAITESLEVKSHYQSYFLGFKSTCLRSPTFKQLIRNIEILDDKQKVIANYEIKLKGLLEAGGLRGCALVPPQSGPIDNPTISDWRGLLTRGGPYLKVQLLRENPRRVSIDGWERVVQAHGYDPDLIARHLRRTLRQ